MVLAGNNRNGEPPNGSGHHVDERVHAVDISIVIPVHNEALNLIEMCRRLRNVLDGSNYEIIFADDGSTDDTRGAVMRERANDPRVKLLSLSRNFGHQEALSAGLDFALGDAVIAMDGDLQHPPELIPKLLDKWRCGYEIVTTVRLSTADAGLLKRIFSRSFYALLNRLSDLNLREGSADFRLMDRVAVNALRQMPEHSRFLRGMVQWIGFKQISVPYHADAREAGVSKYSIRRQLRLGLLATVSFSSTPLYILAMFGFILAAASFLYGIYAIAARVIFNATVIGWASVLAGVMFIGGVQLISLGMLGVYIAKIYEEAKARPVYLIREAHGFTNHSESTRRRTERDVAQSYGDLLATWRT